MHLIKLSIKNAYAHKNTVVQFKDGINWLLGENEGGKSELLDMIGYALFGKGLRSKVTEYPLGLEVKLFFRINTSFYSVERAKSTNFYSITVGEDNTLQKEVIATGKTAVNNAIIGKLGYDYSVYESLNYSKQLDSTALTSAKETERLKLINKINGVEEATAFEKYLDDKRKVLNTQIKTLRGNDLTQSIKFEVDDELEPYANDTAINTFASEISDKYSIVRQLETLQINLNSLPSEPIMPQGLYFDGDEYIKDATAYFNTKDQLEKTIAEVTRSLSKLPPEPSVLVTPEELEEFTRIEANNALYKKQQDFLAKHLITCPACSNEFVPNHTPAEEYKFIDLPFTLDVFKESSNYYKLTKGTKEVLEIRLNEAQRSLTQLNSDADRIVPPYTKEGLDARLKSSRELEMFNTSLEFYKKSKSAFLTKFNLENVEDAHVKLKDLSQLQEEITTLSNFKERVNTYITQKKVYDLAVLTQKKVDDQIKDLSEKLSVYEKTLAESKRLKLEIQNNCIPVLNTIASKMINKLTGGKRYGLTLNETFELTLDGKPIASYSGSTIVLANVAFRLALIEMFFKKTFPVFVGDEIDAFADDIRAQHIHDSLLKLNKDGFQLILVSHNKLEFQGNKINLADIKGK